MVICADGTVTPCSQDFWAKMNMGNVRTQSLKEIWNGAEMRAFRKKVRNGLPWPCVGCCFLSHCGQ